MENSSLVFFVIAERKKEKNESDLLNTAKRRVKVEGLHL